VVETWLDSLEESPAAGVYLHPNVAFAVRGKVSPTLVYAARGAAGPLSGAASAAVLTEKNFRARILPGLPWGVTLKGWRLLGSQLLGVNDRPALEAFVDALSALLGGGGADCVLVDDLEVDSPLWAAMMRAAAARKFAAYQPARPQPHWWITLPERPEEYWQQLSKKTRYNLRRSARTFEHSIVCVRREDEVAEFLGKAHRVSSVSWQSKRRGLRVRNTEDERQFWASVARVGGLRSYLLEHGGRPVAFVLGVQWKGRFVYEEIAYDPAFGEHSPGTVLLFRVLEDLLARDPPRLFDFGSGDGGYKQVFANRQTLTGPVLLTRRGFRPRLAIWLSQSGRAASCVLRKAAHAFGLSRVLRRLYRR
jgi:hypothetical protein